MEAYGSPWARLCCLSTGWSETDRLPQRGNGCDASLQTVVKYGSCKNVYGNTTVENLDECEDSNLN